MPLVVTGTVVVVGIATGSCCVSSHDMLTHLAVEAGVEAEMGVGNVNRACLQDVSIGRDNKMRQQDVTIACVNSVCQQGVSLTSRS